MFSRLPCLDAGDLISGGAADSERRVEKHAKNQHLYLDPLRGVPRPNARSGFAQLARKRKAQFADLATLPASSRRRECVLGEAPSAAEKEQL